MKTSSVVIAAILALMFSPITKADKYSSKVQKMVVSGTSTLHDWSAPASNLSAKGDITVQNTSLQAISSLSVVCLAKSIKSEKESMDEKIYDALKAEDFPNITYTLSRVNSLTKSGEDWIVETTGILTIGGTAKTVDMTVKAKIQADGEIVFTGTKKITLTGFNLERPSAMLGVIKCGDDITLTFSLTMKKA
ncbi:MAG: YceI family protein [Ignavibacteriae bacterium]|nr:YceI family protein [Ignavibacteriota bacterium]